MASKKKIPKEAREMFQEWGKKGGEAKVPKGTAKLSKRERKARAKKAAEARWGKRCD
jgi:uncharacterized protein (UPF0335 family)